MPIRRRFGIVLLALAPMAALGCGWFDDATPEYLYFKVDGPAGTQVQAIYSTQFVASVTEDGVTQINVFSRDSVVQTLPIDTTFYIGVDRQWFVELTPLSSPDVTLKVKVDVDDRNQLNETGTVQTSAPWRFAYLFNTKLSRLIDVVL